MGASSWRALIATRICGLIRLDGDAESHAHLLGGFLALAELLEVLHDALFDDGVLLFGPPLRDGAQALLLEVLLELLARALVGREEREQVFDAAAFEGSREVVHRLVDQVGAEDEGDDRDGHSWIEPFVSGRRGDRGRRTHSL
jgi:hypothetical protein